MHTLQTPDGPMDLYEVAPKRAPLGAVIVIQEAFGVNEYIKDVTGRFAAAGYPRGRPCNCSTAPAEARRPTTTSPR